MASSLIVRLALGLSILSATAAAQQPPAPTDWQSLALRAQQNATVEQMTANGMLSALQTENAELKSELAKLRKPDPPGEQK